MLAATVSATGPAVEEMPEPPESDGAILVEGVLAGVCGTDQGIARGSFGTFPAGADRMVVLHESLGRVLSAPVDSGFAAGDLVAGIVRRPCPQRCAPCAADQWDYCATGDYTERGIKGRHGFGSSRWRIEPEFAIKVDPALGELGVLVEPGSVVAKAWRQVDQVAARSAAELATVLVTGAGPIGLLAALLGVQRGLDVHVLDRMDTGPKPDLVRSLGATYHAKDVGALCCDVVIECSGDGNVLVDALTRTRKNSVTCLVGGAHGGSPMSVSEVFGRLVGGNGAIVGTVNADRSHFVQAATALARADRDWLAGVLTRRVPLGSWTDALTKRDDDVKVVVDLRE